jgi:outer membrane protein assembly factor BamB
MGNRRHSTVHLGARIGGTAVLAATLAGCWWPQTGAGPDRRAHNAAETAITAATVGSLHQLWSAPTDGPAGDPVTSTAGVHVDGIDRVYGFHTNGTLRWSAVVPNGWADIADFTSVLVDGDRVLAVHEGLESTEWIDAANAGLWLGSATGAPAGTGIVADGLRDGLLAGSRSQYLDGIYGETLQIADGATGQVLDGGLLAVSFDPFDAPCHVTLGAAAVFQSGPGLRSNAQGIEALGVRAFPRADVAPTCGPPQLPRFACATWTTDLTGSTTTPVVVSEDQTTLYLGVDSTLHVLDAATGEVLWTTPLGSAITDAPAVGQGRVFVPTSDGQLAVLPADGCGAATCAPTWTGTTGSAITVQPAIAGTGSSAVVVTGGADGGVDAFRVTGCGAAACSPLWSGSAGAPVTGAPAVSNGAIYVGTEAGLVAFGL